MLLELLFKYLKVVAVGVSSPIETAEGPWDKQAGIVSCISYVLILILVLGYDKVTHSAMALTLRA